MHQGLDLSKFRKVAGDKKTSTLRHAKGHEIKIAHDGMSPKMREMIEGLPLHLAEGGDVEAMDPESPEETDDAPQETPPSETPPPEPTEPEEAPPEEVAPRKPGKSADDNVIVVTGQRRPPPPPTAQELDNEDALYASDLQRGHIKPETYQSLYDKKDTLGKIGTLFGLLVSGVGAGLTGQPNAVMEMMKNEINNDLDAQKTSNANAQNWLRLSQAHELQKAQLHRYDVENKLTEAQTGKIPSEVQQNEAHTENIKADTDIKATAAAKNKMLLGATAHMLGITSKMPDGPTKQNATNILQTQIDPAVQSEIQRNNATAAAQLQARSKLRGERHPPGPALVDTAKILQLGRQGAMAGGVLGLPGMSTLTPEQSNAALHEATIVNKNRLVYNNWKNAFEQLDKAAAAGQLNPDNYNTIKSHLAAQLVGSMPQAEAEGLTNSLLPGWKDWGATRQTKASQAYEQFKVQEAATPILDGVKGLKPAFPPPPTLAKARTSHSGEALAAPAGQEIPTGTVKTMHGAQYERVKGGWKKKGK